MIVGHPIGLNVMKNVMVVTDGMMRSTGEGNHHREHRPERHLQAA
jgi:hypothetical protein